MPPYRNCVRTSVRSYASAHADFLKIQAGPRSQPPSALWLTFTAALGTELNHVTERHVLGLPSCPQQMPLVHLVPTVACSRAGGSLSVALAIERTYQPQPLSIYAAEDHRSMPAQSSALDDYAESAGRKSRQTLSEAAAVQPTLLWNEG